MINKIVSIINPSLQGLIIPIIKKTPVFATIQETRSSITRIASIEQVVLLEGKLHDGREVLRIVELGLTSAHCHDHSSVVVAELSAEDEAVCGLDMAGSTS